jgi:hypothetical protein
MLKLKSMIGLMAFTAVLGIAVTAGAILVA